MRKLTDYACPRKWPLNFPIHSISGHREEASGLDKVYGRLLYWAGIDFLNCLNVGQIKVNFIVTYMHFHNHLPIKLIDLMRTELRLKLKFECK